jgi:hypothetical protein
MPPETFTALLVEETEPKIRPSTTRTPSPPPAVPE